MMNTGMKVRISADPTPMRQKSPATLARISSRISGASGTRGNTGGKWIPKSLMPIFTPEAPGGEFGGLGALARPGIFTSPDLMGAAGNFGGAGMTLFFFAPISPTAPFTSALTGSLDSISTFNPLPKSMLALTSRSRSFLIDFSASLAPCSRSFAPAISSSNDFSVAVVSIPLLRSLSIASRRASSMVSRASWVDSIAVRATSIAASCAATAASRAAERMLLPISACAFESSLRARSISLSARSSSAFRVGSTARSFIVLTMPSATLSALSPKARSISRLMARFSLAVAPLSASRITWIGVVNNTNATNVNKPNRAMAHQGVL